MKKPSSESAKASSQAMAKHSEKILGENSAIAVQLQKYYASIEQEELPQIFLELLEKIDQAEAEAKN